MTARLTDRLAARIQSRTADAEAGMVTAEYAVGTVAAAGCAGVLVTVIRSHTFQQIVSDIVKKLFSFHF